MTTRSLLVAVVAGACSLGCGGKDDSGDVCDGNDFRMPLGTYLADEVDTPHGRISVELEFGTGDTVVVRVRESNDSEYILPYTITESGL